MSALRVGVVGSGNIAVNHHLPAYQALADDVHVVGLADPSEAQLEAGRLAAGLSSEQVHADAADLLARPDVDLIDVATPQHLHRDITVAAARAGKHVLCEKPIAAIPADAAAMVAAAADAGVVLAVVHNYLHFPYVTALRSLIAAGELGEVRTVPWPCSGSSTPPGRRATGPRGARSPSFPAAAC